MQQRLSISFFPEVKTGLITTGAALALKAINTTRLYHFLDGEQYITLIAVGFLLAGYFLSDRLHAHKQKTHEATDENHGNQYLTELKEMRFSLTNREFLIFHLIADNKTNKEIALQLCVEVSTVKTHVNNLYSKINCSNRKEANARWHQMQENRII